VGKILKGKDEKGENMTEKDEEERQEYERNG
jgi:hypothetical protein